jgi:hypothetical protein
LVLLQKNFNVIYPAFICSSSNPNKRIFIGALFFITISLRIYASAAASDKTAFDLRVTYSKTKSNQSVISSFKHTEIILSV